MTIRDMVDADLPRVLEINQANVPEVGDATLDHLRFLVAESVVALVVQVEGNTIEGNTVEGSTVEGNTVEGSTVPAGVVGFCLVLAHGSTYDSVNYRWFAEHHPTSWYLDRVAFDAEAQGKGFGSKLYAEVQRRLTEAGAAGLGLEVNVDPPNEPSLAFHAKHGFVEVGRQMSHGIEVSLMHK